MLFLGSITVSKPELTRALIYTKSPQNSQRYLNSSVFITISLNPTTTLSGETQTFRDCENSDASKNLLLSTSRSSYLPSRETLSADSLRSTVAQLL